jgi:hypothetical protein
LKIPKQSKRIKLLRLTFGEQVRRFVDGFKDDSSLRWLLAHTTNYLKVQGFDDIQLQKTDRISMFFDFLLVNAESDVIGISLSVSPSVRPYVRR